VSGNSCLIKRGVVPAAVGSSGRDHMDSTTLLIILLVIVVLGGGFYGRGRWF